MPVICIDCRYMGPRPSGIAKVVKALVDHVPGAAPDLDFLLLKHPAAPERLSAAPNVREVVVKAPANSPTTMWRLPDVVDLSKVDVFHATYNIMPARLGMPCITTVHDIMWLTNPEWCNARFSRFVEQRFYKHGISRALDRSTWVATVSEASRRAICDFMPGAAEKTSVTPLGVTPSFRPGRVEPSVLARLGLRPGRRIILTVGQYVPYKNHEGAIAAFAQAFPQDDGIDLVFVQRIGRHFEHLEGVARAHSVHDRVHYLAVVAEDELAMLYRVAAALLHPSFCEGYGLPLIEAMASGCPIVTSNCSAMPEVVGKAGLLASPDDHGGLARALRSIVDNPQLAQTLRQRGFARARQSSWEKFAGANLQLYYKLF